MEDNLEDQCRNTVIRIENHVSDIKHDVKEINQKLSHFLQCYREDYYSAMEGAGYKNQ